MAPSDVVFPWTIISIRYTLGECVFAAPLTANKGATEMVDYCDDIWVCRELRDTSRGHSF